MRLKNAVRPTLTIDEELQAELHQAQEGKYTVIVTPPEKPTEDPRATAAKLFNDIHGKYDIISIEVHQTASGEIKFHAVVGDKQTAKRLRTHVRSAIDGAGVSEVVGASLPIEEGDVVAGTRIQYEDDYLLSLETARSPTDTGDDPYRAFLDTMADEHNQRAVLQFVARPVGDGWTRSGPTRELIVGVTGSCHPQPSLLWPAILSCVLLATYISRVKPTLDVLGD